MIITKLCGGLGNQMFQYACGRALSLRHGTPLKLDISWYSSMEGCTPRYFSLEAFPALERNREVWSEASSVEVISLREAPLWKRYFAKIMGMRKPAARGLFIEQQARDFEFLEGRTPPLYLQGYWQCEKYFSSYHKIIRKDFSFPALSTGGQALASQIQLCAGATSIHVRRGDYVSDTAISALHGLCSSVYYSAALKFIKQSVVNPHLFIFSDDPAWVRENFDTLGLPAVIVDLHTEIDAHHDMHLMSLCRHHIIANSSFSWWAAWLNEGGNTLVVAPDQWFLNMDYQQLSPVLSEWHKIGSRCVE